MRALVAEAEGFMLYGDEPRAQSGSRPCWGVVVLGVVTGAGDVAAGWRGWMRVGREGVPGFPLGISAEEALAGRDARQDAVDGAGWAAESAWGGFVFRDGEGW